MKVLTIETTPSSESPAYEQVISYPYETREQAENCLLNCLVKPMMARHGVEGIATVSYGAYEGQFNPNIVIETDAEDPEPFLSEFVKVFHQDCAGWYEPTEEESDFKGFMFMYPKEPITHGRFQEFVLESGIIPILLPHRVDFINFTGEGDFTKKLHTNLHLLGIHYPGTFTYFKGGLVERS